jgi:ZIP family zinc transporter/zinc and cadmium transporter
MAAAALGAATFLGVLLTDQLAFLQANGLAIAAGVTLYVGASNLVPEFQAKRGWAIPISFLLGCGLYLSARSLTR